MLPGLGVFFLFYFFLILITCSLTWPFLIPPHILSSHLSCFPFLMSSLTFNSSRLLHCLFSLSDTLNWCRGKMYQPRSRKWEFHRFLKIEIKKCLPSSAINVSLNLAQASFNAFRYIYLHTHERHKQSHGRVKFEKIGHAIFLQVTKIRIDEQQWGHTLVSHPTSCHPPLTPPSWLTLEPIVSARVDRVQCCRHARGFMWMWRKLSSF